MLGGYSDCELGPEVLRVHAQHSEPYPPFRKGRSCHRGGTDASGFRSRLQPPLRAGDAFRRETDLAEFSGALRCGHRWRLRPGLIQAANLKDGQARSGTPPMSITRHRECSKTTAASEPLI